MMKLISWNIGHRPDAWRTLIDSDADIALLQEACEPPSDFGSRFDIGSAPWRTEGAQVTWRTAVVGLSTRVRLERIPSQSLADAGPGDFRVTRLGTIDACHVTDPDTGERHTLISMYAAWESPHTSQKSSWIYADASSHRLISDVSALIGRERGHRVLAAGDLNILYGYGEAGSRYWAARYQTVFDRFATVGLRFVGPQFPNGRQADPWPDELPRDSANVPTFHTNRQTPATATRQLDFVFASADLAPRVKTWAVNDPEQWGPSDHCRLRIEVA